MYHQKGFNLPVSWNNITCEVLIALHFYKYFFRFYMKILCPRDAYMQRSALYWRNLLETIEKILEPTL